MSERIFADAFDRWLREQGLIFRRDRMDKATSCLRGWPDFEIVGAGNRVLFIELKDEKGRLSRDQINLHARFGQNGAKIYVCRSLATAIEIVRAWASTLPEPREPAVGHPCTIAPRLTIRQNGDCGDYVFSGSDCLRRATIDDLKTLRRAESTSTP